MTSGSKAIPIGLKRWFVLHAIVDIVFAFPLMFFPIFTLTLFGWEVVDLISARIVSAALFGIGIESYLSRNAIKEVFIEMLNLKIVWSLAVIFGVSWSLLQFPEGAPWVGWIIVAIFTVFNLVWVYWRRRINL